MVMTASDTWRSSIGMERQLALCCLMATSWETACFPQAPVGNVASLSTLLPQRKGMTPKATGDALHPARRPVRARNCPARLKFEHESLD
jgi:hypothetical protein